MRFVVAWRGGVSSARASKLVGRFVDVKRASVAYTTRVWWRALDRCTIAKEIESSEESSLPKECPLSRGVRCKNKRKRTCLKAIGPYIV